MKNFIVCFLFLLTAKSSLAQVAKEISAPAYIKTVQFKGNTDQSQLPLIKLGETLRLSFDDIIGDETDYYYKIQHYNYDWTPSALAKTEYMEGFDGVRIFDYTNSVSTLQIYTHYELAIPNKNTRALQKSGNYMLIIYNNADEVIFSRKFMVYDSQVAVGVEILRSRDLKFVDHKQTVNFRVDGGEDPLINPDQNIKPVIIQNNDLKTAIRNFKPQYTIGNVLEYRYDTETSFFAGNEFLFFDNKDVRVSNNSIQYIELINLYHNYLYVIPTRANLEYTYNPDINGNYVVRSLQGDANYNSEYVWVHFGLDHKKLPAGEEIYVYGNFNNFEIDDAVKMIYNEENQIYELPLLLKQGFYNYRYVVAKNGVRLPNNPISGDFWQTENEYDVLIYYRRPGGRFDELIGAGNALSTNISNVRRN